MKELFITYPNEVSSDTKLKTTDRFLLLLLIALDNGKGCFAHNKTLAEYLNCSVGTISTSISQLQKFGYVISNEERPESGGRGHARIVKESLKIRKSEIKKSYTRHSKSEPQVSNNKKQINNLIINDIDNRTYSVVQILKEINIPNKMEIFINTKNVLLKKYNGKWTKNETEILADLFKRVLTMVDKHFKNNTLSNELRQELIEKILTKCISLPPKFIEDYRPSTYQRFWDSITSSMEIDKLIKEYQYRYVRDEDESFF